MRIMGLDLGDKKIGVALSDPMGWTAQGLDVIAVKGPPEASVERISELVRQYGVGKIVVGLPRNMNGSFGPRAERARAFAGCLAGALNLPVELWDERMTTLEAEKLLIEADLSRARRRQVIDKMAAVLILQSFLDSQGRPRREAGGKNPGGPEEP
ncbi:MAG: Holliday junction resolvase RuvX [Pelotomaculum sp.]|uniref:Putative pre-16S rRNA nuclease n=1 Tax=Pelotomaculum thermopropionicum (strain DSM 13744 / JCM 10971 / SI) TaxID=370438 RepID=YQGF_PELTS|nr:RecName: Full=Putative pre-16S rRNA nuclease [Pelotomaculum thermopropionicum SI]NPV72979.1 Holliday junction resolvase RuvX [Pelotomaculum sp.]BAF59246.1 predicted endonuclease [Pelotomaculum thermopropionicum SI]